MNGLSAGKTTLIRLLKFLACYAIIREESVSLPARNLTFLFFADFTNFYIGHSYVALNIRRNKVQVVIRINRLNPANKINVTRTFAKHIIYNAVHLNKCDLLVLNSD